MAPDSLDASPLWQLWPNVMSLLILATMSVSLLVLSPWGIDLLYSGLTQFLIALPLVLLAMLTYVAKVKLGEEEAEIPGS